MGLKFIENAGGNKMYHCASCYVYLADKEACVSTSFNSESGQAYLFKRAINVSLGPVVLRQMRTGEHYVRDTLCVSCNENLGWMYEMAPRQEECYKEGCVVLERYKILEIEGITKTSQLEGRRRQPLDINRGLVVRMNNEERRRILERQQADRQQNMNFVFRFNERGELPTVQLFNEHDIAERFQFSGPDMSRMRSNVRRLNAAIRECALGDYTDLWRLGFRADIARQYREIADILDGEQYEPSEEADNNLVSLFERMDRERERMRLHDRPAGDEFNIENWEAQNEIFFQDRVRERRDLRRNLGPRPPLEVHGRLADLDLFREERALEDDLLEIIQRRVREEGFVQNQDEINMMLHLERFLGVNVDLPPQPP